MACPTCDHTMQCVAAMGGGYDNLFWCPRCGTIKFGQKGVPEVPIRYKELVKAANTTVRCYEKFVPDYWPEIDILKKALGNE